MARDRCQHCGCTDIDVDPSRGDAVCTNCGSVLQDTIIVSEVQFEDSGRGGATALGQFVSSDSKGGSTLRGSFRTGIGRESREITLRNAKSSIVSLCQQLRINQHCQDVAFNFFKRALQYHLTRGRRSALVIGACTYIACRTEGTPHMLLDFSDVLQVDVFELGRTYLRLAQMLYINLPTLDPCVHILRFSSQMNFGNKEVQVANTATRLVMRFKRDWIHIGRRPSGICGAALIIAGRLHGFRRSLIDAVKIVKVHESTIRKRLMEFGETPSSALTLDEFMTIDLEEEQDPPSFRAARKKDKDRIQKLVEENDVESEMLELKTKIEEELTKQRKNLSRSFTRLLVAPEEPSQTCDEMSQVVQGSTISTILNCMMDTDQDNMLKNVQSKASRFIPEVGLGPTPALLGLVRSPKYEEMKCEEEPENDDGVLDLEGIDDKEIDSYLMSDIEVKNKTELWMKLNKDYLEELKIKEEKLAQEALEGKPEKKKRRSVKRVFKNFEAKTAGEAIEKMLQEKKLSNKINYDVLRTLTEEFSVVKPLAMPKVTETSPETSEPKARPSVRFAFQRFNKRNAPKDNKDDIKMPKPKMIKLDNDVAVSAPVVDIAEENVESESNIIKIPDETIENLETKVTEQDIEEVEFDEQEEYEEEEEEEELSAAQLLCKYRGEDDYNDDDFV